MIRKPASVADVAAVDGVGTPRVIAYIMTGVAPLTVSAGVVPEAFAVTGLTGIPFAFLACAVVLGIFTFGYVAMARHVPHTGAFYAYIARSLGRVAGTAAGTVAFVAYNFLMVGLYGAFGPTARDTMAGSRLHWHIPWAVYALVAWLVVAVLGLQRLRRITVVLGVLLAGELVMNIALAVNGVIHHAPGPVSLQPLSPHVLLTGGIGVLAVLGTLGFVGFEAGAVLSEQAKTSRTITRATFIVLGVMGCVYALSAFALVAANGSTQVVGNAQRLGPGLFFALAGASRFLAAASQGLFLSSLFAAMVSFHVTANRYAYAAGREGVLFGWLARTNRRCTPYAASLTQSGIGLGVILLYWWAGWDPLTKLFFWLGTSGGFGVLCLLFVTSVAVVVYFRRHRVSGESRWSTTVAPTVAVLLLGAMVVLAVVQYPTLIGETGWDAPAVLLPLIFAVAALIGAGWGLFLRKAAPETYAGIGVVPTVASAASTGFRLARPAMADGGAA